MYYHFLIKEIKQSWITGVFQVLLSYNIQKGYEQRFILLYVLAPCLIFSA